MITLTVSEILRLHQKLLDATGGLSGTRDLGLLESAVYSANQVFGEEEAYPTVEQRAARLAYAHYAEPSICGWKQAYRYAGDADDTAAQPCADSIYSGGADSAGIVRRGQFLPL